MKALAIAILLAISSSSYAASGTMGTSGQQQQQQGTSASDAAAQATNAGNSQNIIFQSGGDSTSRAYIEHGTQRIKNVPSVNAPPLVSSNDTCMGSASGSINGPGFGIAIGKTYTDTNCVMLKNSRELWNMGMRAAAFARMCMDGDNKAALEMTDFECPQTTRAKRTQASVAAQPSPEVTDPHVRRRMGLAPLTP